MKSHLAIEANGKPLVLPEDFSIDIDFQNPMFNETEMFSYPVQIPTIGNRRLLKNIEDVNSDMRSVELEHTPTLIKVDGMPFCSGTMVMQDEEEIKDSISMSVDAADQSFQDLIGDLTCQDIPVKDRIVIGEKIGNLYVKVGITSSVTVVKKQGSKSKDTRKEYGSISPRYIDNVFEPQALGFSYPGKCVVSNAATQEAEKQDEINYKRGHTVIKPKEEVSYINVADAYGPNTFYCNARVCYAHYALDEDGKTSDQKEKDLPKSEDMATGAEPENRGAYWLLDAKRQQSGVCFYVLYFLDCLFDYLGVSFDKSALLEIEDFKHLAFFTTHCKYDTEVLHHGARYKMSEVTNIPDEYGKERYYVTTSLTQIDGRYTEDSISSNSISVQFRKVNYVSGKYYYTDTLTDNGDGTYSVNQDSVVVTDYASSMHNQSVIEYYHYFFENESSDGGNIDGLFDGINKWCSSRGAGGRFSVPALADKSVQDLKFKKGVKLGPQFIPTGEEETATVGVDCQSITISNKITYAKVGANILQMLANSDNFPAESVSTLIESLENAFGIKFDYNYEQRKVTAYLMRDLFRGQYPARDFNGKVYDMVKVSEKITGVRMCYSSESSSKEQRDNVRKGTKDYDTDFDYIQYPDPTTAKKGQTSTIYDQKYEDFYVNLSNADMNVYVDRTTGNAYRIKIDSEYTDAASMKPVLFEVGQWKGMEYGDCSQQNEDFVHEFSIGFTPITFNDVNYKFEVSQHDEMIGMDPTTEECFQVYGFNGMTFQPLLAAFVDEDMEHEFVEQRIDNALSCSVCDVLIRETLSLVENYDTTSTDDGNSPLQTYDWGMAIALMRGGGTDMTSQQYDYNYDGFGNAKWQTVVGQYALCSDTMDAWGNVFDYNGKESGLGAGERFSLKINADKTWLAAWAQERGISLCNDDLRDEQGNITTKIRSRGLWQTFMIDYAYFLLHRKKYRVRAFLEAAQLADIQNHWKEWWRINDKLCLINKAQCSVSVKDGLGECELEVYSL